MLGNELVAALQQCFFKTYFAGIFSSNNIPKRLKNKHFLVINTDIRSGPGKHWIAVVRLNGSIECFDSLGVNNDKKDFILNHFKFSGASQITYNINQLQPSISALCGQYVLYYLFERYHNLDMDFDELVNEIFTDNVMKNDETVVNFMNEYFTVT